MPSDQTSVRSNHISEPVILFWKHNVCVGLGLDKRSHPSGTSSWDTKWSIFYWTFHFHIWQTTLHVHQSNPNDYLLTAPLNFICGNPPPVIIHFLQILDSRASAHPKWTSSDSTCEFHVCQPTPSELHFSDSLASTSPVNIQWLQVWVSFVPSQLQWTSSDSNFDCQTEPREHPLNAFFRFTCLSPPLMSIQWLYLWGSCLSTHPNWISSDCTP